MNESEIMRKLLEAIDGSYREKLLSNGGIVTPEQYAGHQHILNMLVPLIKDMEQATSTLYAEQIITNADSEKLQQATEILKKLCVPLALLTIKQKPQLKLPK